MAPNPCYRIHHCLGGYLVSIVGRGTWQESPAFRDFVSGCLEKQRSVVVNLMDCDCLDSTFLGCLIGLHKQSLRSSDTHFKIFADGSCRMRLLCLSGLDRLFDFASELPAASGNELTLEFGTFDSPSLGRHVMESHRLLAELGGNEAEKFRSIADRLQKELGDSCN